MRQEAIQMIQLHQGSTSTPRGRSYTTAPRDRIGDPRLVQGHRHALIRVGLGRPQLLPIRPKLQEPHDSGLASPKQAEDDRSIFLLLSSAFSWLIQVDSQEQSKPQDRKFPLSPALLPSKRKLRRAAPTTPQSFRCLCFLLPNSADRTCDLLLRGIRPTTIPNVT